VNCFLMDSFRGRRRRGALLLVFCLSLFLFFGLAYQGKDIVYRFIIENSSLMDFGPRVVGLFLDEDF